MPEKINERELTRQIVSVVDKYYPLFSSFLSYLPNPDVLLNDIHESLDIFDRMLLDGHISAMLELRKAGTITRDYNIVPADNSKEAQKIADFVWDCLDGIDIATIIEPALTAIEYGFAVLEVVWKLENGRWMPKEIIDCDQTDFAFKPDGTPVLLRPFQGQRVLDTPYKFIIVRHAPRKRNPYGTPILSRCYWAWQFKKAGLRFWVTMLEKFGVPTVLALFSETDPEVAQERARIIANALSNIQNDAALAISNVDEIQTLESKGKGEDFQALIQLCNAEISKAIVGQVLTSDIGDRGSYALAKVHQDIFNMIVRRDTRMVARAVNTLIRWIVKLNFGENTLPPEFRFDYTDLPGWEQVRDAIDRGIPVSRRALYNVYSLPEPEDDKDAFISPVVQAKTGLMFGDDDFFFGARTMPRKARKFKT